MEEDPGEEFEREEDHDNHEFVVQQGQREPESLKVE